MSEEENEESEPKNLETINYSNRKERVKSPYSKLALAQLGITDTTAYPTSRIQALPHYQDFLDAGWTIGY